MKLRAKRGGDFLGNQKIHSARKTSDVVARGQVSRKISVEHWSLLGLKGLINLFYIAFLNSHYLIYVCLSNSEFCDNCFSDFCQTCSYIPCDFLLFEGNEFETFISTQMIVCKSAPSAKKVSGDIS